jgi:D-lactate dehydrogenase
MKTLVFSSHGFDQPFLKEASEGIHEMDFVEKRLSIETVNLAKGYEAVALFSSDNASKEVLEKLNEFGVKYIALRSVGYDNIDLNTAKNLGVKVANVPAYSPYSIAEHSVTLLMALNRKILLGQQLMDSGDYRLDHLIGFDLVS